MKALLAKAHPLRGQAVVQRQEEPDDGGQTREETEDQTDPHRHLAVRLKHREQRRVRLDGVVQEVLVPADRIARRELAHAPRVEAHEARRHGRVWDDAGRESQAELRPDRLEEPHADDDAQHRHRALRMDHSHRLNTPNSHWPSSPMTGGSSTPGTNRASVSGQPSSGASYVRVRIGLTSVLAVRSVMSGAGAAPCRNRLAATGKST